MKYSLHLQLTDVPQSLNKKLQKSWQHRWRESKAYVALVYYSIKVKPSTPLPKARIRLIRHSHRMLDFDGMVGSFKPVVDALKTCNVIKDDSWDILGKWDCDQVFRPKKDGPLIEVFLTEE